MSWWTLPTPSKRTAIRRPLTSEEIFPPVGSDASVNLNFLETVFAAANAPTAFPEDLAAFRGMSVSRFVQNGLQTGAIIPSAERPGEYDYSPDIAASQRANFKDSNFYVFSLEPLTGIANDRLRDRFAWLRQLRRHSTDSFIWLIDLLLERLERLEFAAALMASPRESFRVVAGEEPEEVAHSPRAPPWIACSALWGGFSAERTRGALDAVKRAPMVAPLIAA